MNKRNQQGFTLVEVMVAVTIFSLVVTVGIGALLVLNDTLKKNRSQRASIDTMNFVMERISREIRTGSQYSCDSGSLCGFSAGASRFNFINQDGDNVSYYLNTGGDRILRKEGTGDPIDMTTPDSVVVDRFRFYVRGDATTDDAEQPFVLIYFEGHSPFQNTETTFAVQTGVSQRLFDLPQIDLNQGQN